MRRSVLRTLLTSCCALLGVFGPVVAFAAPFADTTGARRPDLVLEATLRLLPLSPIAFLAVSALAGAAALGVSARNAWVIRTQAERQARDLSALQARERRLRLAVDDSDDAVLHLDPIRDSSGRVIDFVVTDANARVATLFRRTGTSVRGVRTSTLASLGGETALFGALTETLHTGAVFRAEVRAHPRHVASSELLVRAVRVDDGLALTLTDIRDRKREAQRLRRASYTDALTGLVNRRGFLEHAELRLAGARQRGVSSILFYLDCDAFKAINDTCGHAVGDRALVEIGRALRASVRDTDVVARLGGDEFTMLALDTQGDCASTIRTRIQERLDALNRTQSLPMPVGVSVGHVVVTPHDARSLAELLQAADDDLAHCKRARRAARNAMTSIAQATSSPSARTGRRSAAALPRLTGVASVA
jgi:diguanylate cyclase (GGDEF)-like protein